VQPRMKERTKEEVCIGSVYWTRLNSTLFN